MRTYTIILSAIVLMCLSCAPEEPSANAVLEKSIAYHDPDNQWAGFSGALQVVMETPNRTPRVSDITIDLPNRFFRVVSQRDSIQIDYTVENDSCQVRFNGSSEFTAEAAETYQLNCDRALMYRNYYTYLYGLPMKLRDPGTLLSESVESKTFKGKSYLVLQARYEQEVGSDVWYFYFDPETYAMEVYQFYKTDDNGVILPESGEYILLSDLKTEQGIKMPKVRKWYYNKDDGYLGVDVLQ